MVLLALVLVSYLLKLKVLQYFLGGFSAFFVLAVLVIFQPELRRMLAELGNLPLFATAHEQRENIEVIIQTVERLADVRIGALIAIEQSIQLQKAVESGIPVDCEATPEMLETIFFPNNAIHDGGVIIKGDRIAFAACIFPLTQRQDLNKSLGTRHRAAIGLSEETDAVVVVGIGGDRRDLLRLQRPVRARRHARGIARLSDFRPGQPRSLPQLAGLAPVLAQGPRRAGSRGGGQRRIRRRPQRPTASPNDQLSCAIWFLRISG